MMVRYNLKDLTPELTPEQAARLEEAKKRPVLIDEDCPELTPETARRAYRPGAGRGSGMVSLRVQVMPSTLEKAKAIGGDYMALLGKLLDEAVSRYAGLDPGTGA